MNIYFESIHNLLERNVDLATICEQVGMCFKNEASVTLGDNGKFVLISIVNGLDANRFDCFRNGQAGRE